MEMIFEQDVTVQAGDVNKNGIMKLSAVLHYIQEVSGGHSDQLGFSWDALAEKGLFWAVLRHRVVIHRLPGAGATIHMETWPMPATRAAYPRAVRAMDSRGNILFETVSLWVLMNMQSRAMVLPGRSGVDVPGILRGTEPDSPGSLPPGSCESSSLWTVSSGDLDVNGHVNNARYLDYVEALPENNALTARELTVCYLAEALLGQEITLNRSLSEDGVLTVDGTRPREDDPTKTERVFAVKLCCSVNRDEL